MTKNSRKKGRPSPAELPTIARWEAIWPFAVPVLVLSVALAMLIWTWGTWPDVIVDFGRELYVPWRLTEGEALYRDLAYFNGPLSPHVNALWFLLFGVSLRALALANFGLLCLIAWLLYALVLQVGSRTSALLACLTFLLVFGFSRYVTAGNYNYICPYSHEMTHGLLVSLAAMYFVGRFVRRGQLQDVALCGGCVGLALLTKPEIFVAIAPAAVVSLALAVRSRVPIVQPPGKLLAAFLLSLTAPALVAVGLLSLAMPPADAVRGTFGAYRWMFSSEITSLPFYRETRGVRDLSASLQLLVTMIFWYAVMLGLPAGLGFLQWRTRAGQWAVGAACGVATALVCCWNFKGLPILNLMRPAPLVILAAIIGAAVSLRRESDPARRAQWVMPLGLSLFALLLLAKVFLQVLIRHYSFALAMPAAMLMIVVAWDWAPRAIERLGGSSFMLRGAFLGALLILVPRCLKLSHDWFEILYVPVGSGADAFLADARAEEVNRILGELSKSAPPTATLAAAPEGVMLNYLTRRRCPTPYITLMPVEMLMFGEPEILESFQRDPPDYLVLSAEPLTSYGYANFSDAAPELFPWLISNYRQLDRTSLRSAWAFGLFERNNDDASEAEAGAADTSAQDAQALDAATPEPAN